jgi:hypothetical protein
MIPPFCGLIYVGVDGGLLTAGTGGITGSGILGFPVHEIRKILIKTTRKIVKIQGFFISNNLFFYSI